MMTDATKLDGLIVRNIEDIEAAYKRAENELEAVLRRETAKIFSAQIGALGWQGEHHDSLEEGQQWFAPIEWKLADAEFDEYDLFISFGWHAGLNNYSGSWLAHFVGVNGAGVQLELSSNSISRKQWRELLKGQAGQRAIGRLQEKGLAVDLKNENPITLPVHFDRSTLANAFEDEDENFEEAFMPLANAINTVAGLRDVLDELVAAVRTF
jgi:hypothetical protein